MKNTNRSGRYRCVARTKSSSRWRTSTRWIWISRSEHPQPHQARLPAAGEQPLARVAARDAAGAPRVDRAARAADRRRAGNARLRCATPDRRSRAPGTRRGSAPRSRRRRGPSRAAPRRPRMRHVRAAAAEQPRHAGLQVGPQQQRRARETAARARASPSMLHVAARDHGLRIVAGQRQQRQRRADDGVAAIAARRSARCTAARSLSVRAGGLEHAAPRRAADSDREPCGPAVPRAAAAARGDSARGPRDRALEQRARSMPSTLDAMLNTGSRDARRRCRPSDCDSGSPRSRRVCIISQQRLLIRVAPDGFGQIAVAVGIAGDQRARATAAR